MNKLLLCVLLSLSTGVNAEALQSLADIDSAVKKFVSQSLQDAGDSEFTLGRLDPRLRLAACESALKMRFSREASSGGRNAVEVRCEGVRPWSIYVTVDIARFERGTVLKTRSAHKK